MVPASIPGHLGKMCVSMVIGLALAGCGGGSSGDAEPPSAVQPARVAVTGTIDIEAGTRVDADNADALLSRFPLASAQRLPAEFIIAGYVSDTVVTGDYPSSPGASVFQYFPDPEDRFVAPLQSGLELTIQSFATRLGTASDLELTVRAPDGTLVDNKVVPSDGSPVVISVSSGQTGDYTLSVTSSGSAPMLYILTSSRTETSAAGAYSWPDHEFVEGEAIVSLSHSRRASARSGGLSATALMNPGREIAPGLWSVRRPGADLMTGGSAQRQTLDWIRQLRKEPGIQNASPNYRVRAWSTPANEPLYTSNNLGQQWHYSLINGPTAWQLAPGGGTGVRVAVMDTGLFRQANAWHSDLNGNVASDLTGTDFVSSAFDNDSEPGRDHNPADPGNSVGSSVYHGTHVAGTISAVVNGSGGAGVAFNSTLLPVRVLGEGGSGSSADLLAALEWIAGPDGQGPEADIVNLSLGGLPFIQSLQDAINQGSGKGVIYVAAAGNSSTDVPSFPAAFDNVFAVSAVDGAGSLSSYSNFGSWVDLAAPGGDASRDGNGDGRGDLVSSTSAAFVDGKLQAVYRGLQGTSMAAPHLAGVIALMKEAEPDLNSAAVESYLRNGDLTQPPCDPGCSRNNQLGYGVLDAGKAMQTALAGTDPPELLTSSPAVVNLATESDLAVSQSLELSPLGDYTISITGLSASDDWFTASPVAGPLPLDATPSTPVELELTLNPDRLEPGISSRGSLQVSYTTPGEGPKTLDIAVIGKRITDLQARDAGRHFVLLVEPEPDPQTGNFVTVGQAVATADDGQYRFEFVPDDGRAPELQNEIPPGDYILVAGSDLDNDGVICHSGEACAEYPVSGLRQAISVRESQPVTGLKMTTSYSRPTISAGSEDLLPRPAFQGYRLLPENSQNPSNRLKAIPNP